MGQELEILANEFRTNPYTIVVYWRQRTGFDSLQNGHAALVIDSSLLGVDESDYYVSWQGTGKGKSLGTKFAADQATYRDDAGIWGGRAVGDAGNHRPTQWVALRALDRLLMKAAWDQMRGKEGAHWKLFDKNCATAVARILKAGGGDDHATKHSKQLVWWPTDLLKYAKSMGDRVVRTS